MESMANGCRDSADNCETKSFELSKTNKNVPASPAAGTASPPRHALLAPSFSIVEDTKGSTDVTPPPDIPPSEGDPWGDGGSPLTARSASSLGRLVPERTARAEEEAARGPPADRSSHWAVAAGPNKAQRETEGTPPTGSLSLTPSEVVWRSSSSDCGRKGGCEEEYVGRTERRTRASSNPVPIGGDLGSSGQTKGTGGQEQKLDELSLPTRWTPIEACSLAAEDEKARSDQNERRHERGATPPLSQVHSESVLRGSPREPTGNLEGDGGAGGDLMLFRTDVSRHLVSGEQPALFFLRPSENLSVTRIEGTGRLLVTLREEAGSAAAVVIDGATVHDSAAHFGHEAVQTDHRFPYVAGHRYEFQVAPAQGVELAVRGGGGGESRQGAEASQGCAANTSSGLHVVFSVMSAYSKGARVCQKDAMRLSLRTFEAPAANGSRQPTKPKSPATAMTKDPPTPSNLDASATATVDEGISAPRRPSLKEQDHAGDQRRTPSPSVAAALLASCLSPPPEVKHNHLIGTAPREEPSAPTAGVQPPAAAPKTPQPSSSTRTAAAAAAEGGGVQGGVRGRPVQSAETTGGNQSAGAATRGQRQPGSGVDPASTPYVTVSGRPPPSGMEGAIYPSAERLRWNPAWEQQRLLPQSPSAPAEMLPPSHAPSLPHIRRHVDSSSSSASPRSTLGRLEPSGVAGSHHVPRDPAIGAPHRYVLPPGYPAGEHPVQSKRYVGAEDAPGTKASRHYYQPAHEERHHGAPRYHYHRYVSDGQRDVASPGHQAGEGVRELEWNRGRRKDRHASGRGYRVSPEQARGGRRPSRWRDEAEDGEDWTRNGRPGLRRRSASQEDPLAGGGGDRYGSQAATGGGHNGEEYSRPYRFHHGSRKHKASPQSDDNNSGGYKHGGGCLPPSGKARWEPKKTVGAAVSPHTSRRRTVVAAGVAMGRKAAGEQSAFELTEGEAYHVRNGGGYLESLIADKAPCNRGLNEDDGWYGGEPGRQRTPQWTENNIGRQPPGRQNSRQDNTGGPARQTGITTSVVTSRSERMPPRWIKF
ncbi:hypothetical protein Esi_0206_0034 [Ectocarpus siliculosus]|uniref:Uncharacterized protein n=1 Tax=Ectocarpus siliculosus TaxID=2880 RepID=D8LI85_ECTSI|nr:hypothetical protein Esi_0206_0034 [Ectocarpus siliculosus]|eukprot:CBN75907.1 hypothetical protein Esi_0206_0034 [Ectocarpus siliculosus]